MDRINAWLPCRRVSIIEEMPRGWRETHKPETADSHRGWRRLPWRKEESTLPSDHEKVNETRKIGEFSIGVTPVVLNDTVEAIPSNKTESLTSNNHHMQYSLADNLAKGALESADGSSNPSSLGASGLSSESDQATSSTNASKPLSLLPFLGMPSTVGARASIMSPTSPSVPQWMQLLGNHDAQQMMQYYSSDGSSMQQLQDEFKRLKFEQCNWEKEPSNWLSQQEFHEGELRQVQQAKEQAEQQIGNLQRQLRTKEEHIHELETTLSTTQQALEEYRRKEPCDWAISRDEIHLTEKCLGVGGWGTVVLGKFRGCEVAVKQIHELILSPHNRRLFEREMNIASRCRHPCLLQFIGATNDEGSPLFVTELMETSLRGLLEQRQLSEIEITAISLDVALALNYLHKSKPPIIHRDVSSANVLLWHQGDQWRGKVSDYGTANFMQQTMTVAPGAMIYSAPEALTPNQTVKPRSYTIDVYSFGVLLCEMSIRELPDPKQRKEQVALVTSHMFRSLIRQCLQPDPEKRPLMEDIIVEYY